MPIKSTRALAIRITEEVAAKLQQLQFLRTDETKGERMPVTRVINELVNAELARRGLPAATKKVDKDPSKLKESRRASTVKLDAEALNNLRQIQAHCVTAGNGYLPLSDVAKKAINSYLESVKK